MCGNSELVQVKGKKKPKYGKERKRRGVWGGILTAPFYGGVAVCQGIRIAKGAQCTDRTTHRAHLRPSMRSSFYLLTIENAVDDRNKTLAARGLADAVANSTQPAHVRRAYLEKALKQKLPTSELKLIQERLKKIPLPKSKKK